MDINNTFAAYLAALIDGEGNINLSRLTSKNRKSFRYSAAIHVYNTNPALKDIAAEAGLGTVQQRQGRNKPIFIWAINSNDCRKLLPAIAPYLRFKRPQAEALAKYLNLAARCHRYVGIGRPKEKQRWYHEECGKLWQTMKCLNG